MRSGASAMSVLLALIALIGAGCAQQRATVPSPPAGAAQSSGAGSRDRAATSPQRNRQAGTAPGSDGSGRAHPQAIEPVAGAVGAPAASPVAQSAVSVGSSGAGPDRFLAQPVSDTQIRQELARSGMSASPDQATLTPAGLAVAPIDAPTTVQDVIAAGNQIARLPYRYGGGHMTYEDTAYDCSGSISFVFDAAHLLSGSVVSGDLENWGRPGPGKWITVFANAGHTFMYVAGLRFDTVALAETGSRWSGRSADEPDLSTFAVRHPPGL